MEKTIKLNSKQSIKLNNNVSWLYHYRDQFGRDIVPVLIPLLNSGVTILYDIMQQMDGEKLSLESIRKVDRETFEDALIQLAGLELTDLINITWAMAKACDDDIDGPKEWVKEFDNFPIDVIVPDLVEMIITGMTSTKNSKRLLGLVEDLKETQTEQPA